MNEYVYLCLGTVVEWIVGPRNKGDCNLICGIYDGTCDDASFDGLTLETAKEIAIANGEQCAGWNQWDYGQGLSQCTSSGCCGTKKCQFDCSYGGIPQCVIEDGFNLDHSRICPCLVSSTGKFYYKFFKKRLDNSLSLLIKFLIMLCLFKIL